MAGGLGGIAGFGWSFSPSSNVGRGAAGVYVRACVRVCICLCRAVVVARRRGYSRYEKKGFAAFLFSRRREGSTPRREIGEPQFGKFCKGHGSARYRRGSTVRVPAYVVEECAMEMRMVRGRAARSTFADARVGVEG